MSGKQREPAGLGARPMRGSGRGYMGGMMVPGEKAKDFKGTLKRLMSYLSRYKAALALVFVFSIGSTVFMITGPNILGDATTEIYSGIMRKLSGAGGIDMAALARTLAILTGLYVVSALFSFLQGYLMAGVSQRITYTLRSQISEKINRMPMGYFESRTHGEVLSRITNDVDMLSHSLSQSVTQLIISLCTIAGVFVMMVRISWQMTLAALLILPFSMTVITAVMKRSQRYFVQQQEHLGKVNGQVEEVFGGLAVVKANNAEHRVSEDFDKENGMLYSSAWKSQFLSGLIMPMMVFIGNLSYVGVSILGGYLAARQAISVGDILAFIQYTRLFNQPIFQVAQVSNMLQTTMAAAERVFELLSEPEEKNEARLPAPEGGFTGNVTFNRVRFGYNPEKPVIRDFSVDIGAGRKVAIVGPTGAGKTTVVKLLMRFYDVDGGAILIDGRDIRLFERRELRRSFGMVLQDTWLFADTIMENIRYGRPGATDEEVIAAAKAAHAHHFVTTLPGGYQMVLNEETSNISEGQKQLLTIARAILADPKVLILDEATSSVDTRTELQIQQAMDNLMRGRTNFVIAHRLSTVRNADIILVMRDGDIVEQGSHAELLERGGFYTELYNSQFKGATA